MDYNQMAKKIVDFQKISFETWYNSVTLLQDQAASSMEMVLNQSCWAREDSRQPIQQYINLFQQERGRFKDYVEQGFGDLEKFVSETAAEASKSASKSKKQTEKQQAAA